MASGVATMAHLLLVLAQLSAVCGLPAGGVVQEHSDLDEREIPTPSSLPPTTSYSTAITSLQSVSISILPSITGVRVLISPYEIESTSYTDEDDRASSQDYLLGAFSLRTLSMAQGTRKLLQRRLYVLLKHHSILARLNQYGQPPPTSFSRSRLNRRHNPFHFVVAITSKSSTSSMAMYQSRRTNSMPTSSSVAKAIQSGVTHTT